MGNSNNQKISLDQLEEILPNEIQKKQILMNSCKCYFFKNSFLTLS